MDQSGRKTLKKTLYASRYSKKSEPLGHQLIQIRAFDVGSPGVATVIGRFVSRLDNAHRWHSRVTSACTWILHVRRWFPMEYAVILCVKRW